MKSPSEQTWIRVKNGANKDNWTMTEEKQVFVEDDLYEYEDGERFQMVVFLGFVILIFAAMSALLFAGLVRTVALRANPAVDVAWLYSEIKLLAGIVVIWQFMVAFGIIIVHARIGRLIAKG